MEHPKPQTEVERLQFILGQVLYTVGGEVVLSKEALKIPLAHDYTIQMVESEDAFTFKLVPITDGQ
jgi:hypothetical protein